MTEEDPVAVLYAAHEKLTTAGEEAAEEASFALILAGAKGDDRTKQLASQFIPQFASWFPDKVLESLDALFDLCEDIVPLIRMYAIRGVAALCQKKKEHTQVAADVLAQLLLSEEKSEAVHAERALLQLIALDKSAVFAALLQHVMEGNDQLREKTAAMFEQQVRAHTAAIVADKEALAGVVDGLKKVLAHDNGVTAEEFSRFITLLTNLKAFTADSTLAEELVHSVIKQSGFDSTSYDAASEEQSQAFIASLTQAGTLIAKGASNDVFMTFFFQHIIPVFDQISDKNRLLVLKAVAETSSRSSIALVLENFETFVDLLKHYLPREEDGSTDEEGKTLPPKINFSFVECLLYLLHQFSAKSPALTYKLLGIKPAAVAGQPKPKDEGEEEDAAKQEDFRARLEFLQKSFKGYISQVEGVQTSLRKMIAKSTSDEEKKTLSEKKASVEVALRTTGNIQTIVANLVGNKPTFAPNVVSLSWKPQSKGKNQRNQGQGKAGKKAKFGVNTNFKGKGVGGAMAGGDASKAFKGRGNTKFGGGGIFGAGSAAAKRKSANGSPSGEEGAKRYKPGQMVALERGTGKLKGKLAEGRIAWRVPSGRKR